MESLLSFLQGLIKALKRLAASLSSSGFLGRLEMFLDLDVLIYERGIDY